MAKRWRARSGRRTAGREPVRTVPAPPASGLVEALLAGGGDAGRPGGGAMSELEFVALVLAAIGPLLALAKLTGLPQIFLLAGAGLGSAFLPGLPPMRVDPQFLLSLFLPPLLYAGTVQVSVHMLRFASLSGVLVGALVSVCTILAVAAAAR